MNEAMEKFLDQGLLHYREAKSTVSKFEDEIILILKKALENALKERALWTALAPTDLKRVNRHTEPDKGPCISAYVGGKWAGQDNYLSLYVWWNDEFKKPVLGVGFDDFPEGINFKFEPTDSGLELYEPDNHLYMEIDNLKDIQSNARKLIETFVAAFSVK